MSSIVGGLGVECFRRPPEYASVQARWCRLWVSAARTSDHLQDAVTSPASQRGLPTDRKGDKLFRVAEAVYGFVGVLIGSVTTAALTVYRERLVSSREREARQQQCEQDQKDQRDAFQRQSLLALQEAISDLIKAVYNEQDRMLEEMRQTDRWPARQWETPTATGWKDAELRLLVSRARIFDDVLRDVAHDIHEVAMKDIWASTIDEAKQLNVELRKLHERFNALIIKVFPELY